MKASRHRRSRTRKRRSSSSRARMAQRSRRSAVVEGSSDCPSGSIVAHNAISSATCFNWKKKYAGMLPTDMKQLRALEDENSRLKKSWPT